MLDEIWGSRCPVNKVTPNEVLLRGEWNFQAETYLLAQSLQTIGSQYVRGGFRCPRTIDGDQPEIKLRHLFLIRDQSTSTTSRQKNCFEGKENQSRFLREKPASKKNSNSVQHQSNFAVVHGTKNKKTFDFQKKNQFNEKSVVLLSYYNNHQFTKIWGFIEHFLHSISVCFAQRWSVYFCQVTTDLPAQYIRLCWDGNQIPHPVHPS